MAVPFIQTSFAAGEIAPSLFGHVEIDKWHAACSTLRNMFVGYRGGAYSRPGFMFVGHSKQRADLFQAPPRVVTWQFNNQQGYMLEFGQQYLRFVFFGGVVVEGSFSITSITNANPAVVTTSAPHGYVGGDWVIMSGIQGPSLQLNGNEYQVAGVTASTFQLQDVFGNPIDSTLFPAYTGGGTVARVYTISTPYAAADLPLLKFGQSADVMSITHPNYAPMELARLGPTNWTLTATNFNTVAPAVVAAPTVVASTQPNPAFSPPTLPAAYAYVVTTIDATTGEESQRSPIGNVTNGVDMAITAGSNIVTWAQTGSNTAYYKIYRAPTSYNSQPGNTTNALPVPAGALFGLVGESFGTQFVDANVTPDFSQTPPLHKNPFAGGQVVFIHVTASSADWTGAANVSITTGTGTNFFGQVVVISNTIVAVIILNAGQNYLGTDTVVFSGSGTSASATLTVGPATGNFPSVVSYFQERRTYADTLNQPDTLFFSQPGAFHNMDSGIPVVDSDAITATPWSEKVDGIQFMISMPLGLLTFTGSAVWQVGAPGSFASSPAAITPSNIIAAPQSNIGSSSLVPPQKINWDVLYIDNYGQSVLDLTYQIFFNIYAGTDISWQSSHLLFGQVITSWAYARQPFRVQWAVRSDGQLLSLTYLKEQQVAGWARHDTQGMFRSICSVVENTADGVYVVSQRPYLGSTQYYIERMDNRFWSTVEDVWCVDAAIKTPLITPNAIVAASSPSGVVNFIASSSVFSPSSVGQILRMSGGIASITSYTSGTLVQGTWISPATLLIPDDPFGTVLPQNAGSWTLMPLITQVGGLSHLNGRQVVGVADGVPIGPITVPASGIITLPFQASIVVLGLGFTSQLQTVYLDTGQPTIQGRRKSIYAVTVRGESTALPQIGANRPDSQTVPWSGMVPAVGAHVSPGVTTYVNSGGQTVTGLYTGDAREVIQSNWLKTGQVAVQQTLPLPLNVLAVVPEILDGDSPEAQISPRQRPQPERRAA